MDDHTYATPYTSQKSEKQHHVKGRKAPSTDNNESNIDTCEILDVPGDGNCFFHCLSLFLYGDFHQSHNLRGSICRHIFENWAQWENVVQNSHYGGIDQTLYYIDMLYNQDWATSSEVIAATHILQISITVWLKGTAKREGQMVDILTPRTYGGDLQTREHVDVLLAHNHYRLIKYADNLDPNEVLSQEEPNKLNKRKHEEESDENKHQKKCVNRDRKRDKAFTQYMQISKNLGIDTTDIINEIQQTSDTSESLDVVTIFASLQKKDRDRIVNKLRRRIRATGRAETSKLLIINYTI